MKTERLFLPGVRALEVAHLTTPSGVPLWQVYRDTLNLPRMLATLSWALAEHFQFDAVHVYGGRASNLETYEHKYAPKPIFFSKQPRQWVLRAPLPITECHAVFDCGKTAIKAMCQNTRNYYSVTPSAYLSTLREAMFDMYKFEHFEAMVVALPYEVRDDLTFANPAAADVSTFFNKLERWPACERIYFLNDAELAGWQAQHDTPILGRVLALTLGAGVGAALATTR